MNLSFFPFFFPLPPTVCMDQSCIFCLSLCSVRLNSVNYLFFHGCFPVLRWDSESFPEPVPLHLNSVMRLLRGFLRKPCHCTVHYYHLFSLLAVPVLLLQDSSYLPLSQAELFWGIIMFDKALTCVRYF